MVEGHYGLDFSKPAVGTSSRNGASYADILAGDGQPVPPVLRRGNHVPRPRMVSYDRYFDPRYVALEVEHIWNKCWQVACREEDIPNVGDRLTYDIVDRSYIIVRTTPKQIKAFYNSCPHRARRLCTGNESGSEFRCAFHGWTWNLDGKLLWVPGEQDFPHVSTATHGLQDVRVETWGGNVFINPDPAAPSLGQALGPAIKHFADFPLEERYTVLHVRKKVRANWKVTQEAFMEGYHVIETHWDGMPFFGSSATQYDVWDDGVAHLSRLVTPSVVPDAWVADQVTPETGLRLFCETFGLPAPPSGRGRTVADARRYAADARRKQIEAVTGEDLSQVSNAYLLDMAKYFVFPNHHPWWGEALPWWYRFLPIGDDPDQSMMEIRVTARVPDAAPRPASATPIDIDFDERAADYEDRLGVLGYIVDQDIANLIEIQRGFKAAKPDMAFLTLARYQECNIQHFHEVYDRLLGLAELRPLSHTSA